MEQTSQKNQKRTLPRILSEREYRRAECDRYERSIKCHGVVMGSDEVEPNISAKKWPIREIVKSTDCVLSPPQGRGRWARLHSVKEIVRGRRERDNEYFCACAPYLT